MKLSNLYRSYHAGIFWQRPVISKSVNDPTTLTPEVGDRYIVGPDPANNTAWEGHANEFTEYQSDSTWTFTYPIHSHAALVEDENTVYIYSYGEWLSIGRTWTTDEEMQDAVGSILDDGSVERIIFTYDDENDIISADFKEFDVDHDLLNNYFANEHIDWTISVTHNIHDDNITSSSVTQHEEDIDHDALTNFVSNEHINHSNTYITTSGILSGGGDLTSSRDINLEHSDVDHDQTTNFLANEHIDWTADQGSTTNIHDGNITSSSVTQHEGDINHQELTNVHQNVYINSVPEFNQINITSDVVDGTHATTKDYVDNLIQGLNWQESVIDFYDASTGLPSNPADGDRYISTATANGWTVDNIYEWDADNSTWVETVVEEGYAVWVETEDVQYTYQSGSWKRMASVFQHNNLSGLQGGISGERYHLQESAYNNLSSQDQTVYTTSDVVFDDISITNPTSAYNLDHDSFSGFVSNEHIDHTNVSILTSGIVSGGGDLTSSRTITLNNSDVDHDSTTNFVSNEHINHTNVSITGGTGISGGGDLTSSRTLSLDLNSLTTESTTEPGTDYVPFYDSSTGSHKNITPNDLIGSVASYTSVSDNGTQVTSDTSDINFSSNINVSDDGDSTVTVTVPNDLTVMSNYNTDDLSEGNNLYFTTTRVDNHLSGSTGISYSTGTITNTDTGSDAVSSHESTYDHTAFYTSGDDATFNTVSIQTNDQSSVTDLTLESNAVIGADTSLNFVTNSEFTFSTGASDHTSGTAGTEVVRIDDNQRVGIGYTSPSYKLDVDGGIRGSSYYGATTASRTNTSTTTLLQAKGMDDHRTSGDHDSRYASATHDNASHSSTYVTDSHFTGGEGIAYSSGTIDLDVNSLTTETSTDSTGDYVPFYDSSTGSHKNITPDNLVGGVTGDFLYADGSNDATGNINWSNENAAQFGSTFEIAYNSNTNSLNFNFIG